MCGIAGYLQKNGTAPLGQIMMDMLAALERRGPDSTGVALWHSEALSDWLLRVKLGEPEFEDAALFTERIDAVVECAGKAGMVLEHNVDGPYARLIVDGAADPGLLTKAIEEAGPYAEMVSCGHTLEIVKQVGSPQFLDETFGVSGWTGTHAIGHTRLSTESKIDLSHSQPFWAHGVPDIASVHNGHITNYHKLRRIYEQKGVRFHTENDSEVIGIYLADRIAKGDGFEGALHAATGDFDGSYCFLAADGDCLAYVKDGFGFKPLVLAETDDFVAIATEEIALRQALGDDFSCYEPPARGLQIWRVPQAVTL